MNCYKHGDRTAVNRCNECGQYVCSECEVTIKGVPYCKNCVSRLASQDAQKQRDHTGKTYGSDPRTTEYHYHKSSYRPKSSINSFFLFVLSAVPGLNYMYMGLMKRGMFFMSLFFFLWFAMACLNAPALLFLIFMEMCYSFFDGFQIRRKIICGEHISDSIDAYMDFIKNNKVMLSIGVFAIAALGIVNNLTRSISYMGYGYRHDFLRANGFGLAIVIIGIVIIYKSFKKTRKDGDEQ